MRHKNLPNESQGTPPKAGMRNVYGLGFVSMFNDIASEMVYPVIPIFLTTILKAPVAAVGVIEGIAEATASILKVFSGWFSDRFRHRKWFVAAGYSLSAISKVLLAIAASWPGVLLARFVDRFGKGTRTSARDALIADSSPPEKRGMAFGLHRGMDTAGAVLGPLLALLFLYIFKESYSTIFLIAAIPAAIGVFILLAVVKEPRREIASFTTLPKLSIKQFNRPFKIFVLVNMIFALGNSSDAFLILRSESLGYTTVTTVLLYVVFNAVYSVSSYPFGKLADRFGPRPVLIVSFLFFSLVYAGFGLVSHRALLWGLFPLYGIYMGMSEGIGKAYITHLVPVETRGTALGLFYTLTGIIAFFASLIAGLLWNYIAVPVPFFFGAIMSFIAGILFIVLGKSGGID